MATAALRVDAERNRRRILAAAGDLIAREGVDTTVEAIAQAAGVGMGTLYRRFPTKEALVGAILTDLGVAALADVAQAGDDPDPWSALEGSLRALARRFAENRGLLDALEQEAHSCRLLEIRGQLLDALEPVLARAQQAGATRDDVDVADALAIAALQTKLPAHVRAAAPGAWERFLGIALDGLRAGSATPLRGERLPRTLS
jgi:AcrR family transcriptional regulator